MRSAFFPFDLGFTLIPRILLLVSLLLVALLINLCMGAITLTASEAFQTLFNPKTLSGDLDAIVWQIRLPRILCACSVGGALAVAGYLLQTLSKNYLADPYLTGVSKGAIVVLCGPNGVGKSTVLKTLAGQIQPLAGKITLGNDDIHNIPVRTFSQNVAYVPQLFDPPPNMSSEDVVALGRSPHQMWWSWHRSTADNERIEQALKLADIESLRNKPVGELSGGERQRVSIAVVLAQDTRFILLDEPLTHLDYKHQVRLTCLLVELKHQNIGLLVVVHDLNIVWRLADRVIMLKQTPTGGAVASTGAPAAVLTPEMLLEVYEVEVAVATEPGTGIPIFLPLGKTRAR